MRRPRHKLQVSTFPFLAVLLCAMGALILFLLVMDRRAKIVARNKGLEALAARSVAQEKQQADANAEWEQQRERLHQTLQGEHAKATKEAAAAQEKLAAVEQQLGTQNERFRDLGRTVASEETQLKKGQALAEERRSILKIAEKQEAVTKRERDQALKEVQELEQVVEALKTLKKGAQHTYSVVPYRGKHGDGRKPIYVECARDGLVFYPDKRTLAGDDFTVPNLRGEVERRAGGLTRATKSDKDAAGETAKNPYVLFLIRPDGISNYYKAQAALKGYQVDFGYEAVDQHWVLDFAAENVAASAAGTDVRKHAAPALLKPQPDAAPKLLLSTPGSMPVPALTSSPLRDAGTGSLGAPTLSSGATNPLPGIGGPSVAGAPISALNPPDSPKFMTVVRPPSAPIAIPASSSPSKVGVSQATGGRVIASTNERKTAPGLPIIASTSDPKTAPDLPIPGASDVKTSGRQASGAPVDEDGPPKRPTLPPPGTEAKPVPPAPALGNLIGNRDFTITLVCFGDHVTVYPGGRQHRWKGNDLAASDGAIVQNVRDLIERRQASVRPGEPPYRPLLRFQLAADGLRVYLHVYPQLEFLRVPMTREALED